MKRLVYTSVLLAALGLLVLLGLMRTRSPAAQARTATDAQNVELVGHIGGKGKAVFVQGDYAYLGEGPRLTILDISTSATPTVVGKTAPLPDIVNDVLVADNYAYVADDSSGLRVMDVSNPASPTEVGLFDTPGSAWGVTISGTTAYVADHTGGLRVVDVSDPASPTELGFYNTSGHAFDVYISGTTAYVADGSSGLRVVDVGDPYHPTELGSCGTGGVASGVYVSGRIAYVTAGVNGLRVVDVSDPANPTEVSFYNTSGYAYGVYVSGTTAYVADGSSGLRVVDVSDPASPAELGSYNTPGYAAGVYVSGTTAYVADGSSGLRVVDVSDPVSPSEVGFYDTLGHAKGVYVSGTTAYVADESSGLRVVDVSDPAHPAVVGFYDTPGKAEGTYVSGTIAYVADHFGGLQVVDVSDPASPAELGSYNTPGYAEGVYVSGSIAYVADHDGGLRVVDVSVPGMPTEVGFYDTPGSAFAVYVSGTIAYVADYDSGLRVVDVSDPISPTEVGFYDTPEYAYDVYVSGTIAYVAEYYGGLRVVDVSDPISPSEIGFCESHYAVGVYVSGSIAYLADSLGGLRVVDVSVPGTPTEVGFYDTPEYAYDVYVSGTTAYLTDSDGGLLILRYTESGPTPTPTPTSNGVTISGLTEGIVDNVYTFTAAINPITATGRLPITYTWQATDQSLVRHGAAAMSDTITYTWETTGVKTLVVTATNYPDPVTDTHAIAISASPPSCPHPLSDVGVGGPTSGYTNTLYAFTAVITPSDATLPITYTWSPTPASGQGTAGASYQWATPGVYTIILVAGNCGGVVSNPYSITISAPPPGCPRPLSDVSISGPTEGYTSIPYNFTAVIIPVDATEPITYTWSPAPTSGQGTESVTYTWDMPGAHAITLMGENCGGPISSTHAITISSTPPPGDNYEIDDTCAQASTIPVDGTAQFHTFHVPDDKDWVTFEAISGTTYLVEARTPSDSLADVILQLYDACGVLPTESQDHEFTPDIRLRFTAPQDGPLYLRLNDYDPSAAGPDVSYYLSVRVMGATATPGAVVLVAGRIRLHDPVQNNIYHVTNSTYRLFRAHGYDGNRIYYLANDLDQDADNDGWKDVDAVADRDNVQVAITQWAVDKVGPDRAFTIYLMDHGGEDVFYLNGPQNTVSPDNLNTWLGTLEATVPEGLRVNVIVAACHSGSFLDSLSKPGRVVMASTGTYAVAYATQDGAVFSDAFLGTLGLNASLYGAFEEARWVAEEVHPDQTPWLDDNGDGIPNSGDGLEAQRRGFAYAGTFAEEEKWPPYIAWANLGSIQEARGVITADVRDDKGVFQVWAVIYKPSYVLPDPDVTEEIVQEILPTVQLLDPNFDGIYTAEYEGFNEVGEYRIVIYAVDQENLEGRPKTLTVQVGQANQVYLPLVLRSFP